ncbi:PH domain-containing protein [Rothia sp. P6271]|uniref:PH domain-containing protein n=1 Tax=Rothia sp. P6271 TaxID=3402659 RepID=UPI003AC088E5
MSETPQEHNFSLGHDDAKNNTHDEPQNSEQVPDEELHWKRAHPLSPLASSWFILAWIVWITGKELFESGFLESDTSLLESLRDFLTFITSTPKIFVPALLSVVIYYGVTYLGWFFTFFAVGEKFFHLKTGVLVKKNRKANINKIQSIDITSPFLARLFGLSEMTVDVADGDGSALSIKFLKHQHAQQLRSTLLQRITDVKQSQHAAPTREESEDSPTVVLSEEEKLQQFLQQENLPTPTAVEDSSEQELLRVPPKRLVASLLLDVKVLFQLLILFIFIVINLRELGGYSFSFSNITSIIILFGFASSLFNTFARRYNFRIADTPEGLKIRYGLFDTVTQSVPVSRIQGLQINQSVLWRSLNWYKVVINVAGYGIKDMMNDKKITEELVVLATGEELEKILDMVLPVHEERVTGRWLLYAHGTRGTEAGFRPRVAKLRWLRPLSYRRAGFTLTDKYFILRDGVLYYKLSIIPYQFIQSVDVRSSPLERHYGARTVNIWTIVGPISATNKNIHAEDAQRIVQTHRDVYR